MTDYIEPANVETVKKYDETSVAKRKGIRLRVEHVSVSYGGVSALKDISFSLDAGERLGLIGHSGAGKTTLCDVISGKIRHTGKVVIPKRRVPGSVSHARKGIRRVNARPVIYKDLTLLENVLLGIAPSKGDGVISAMLFPRLFYKEKKEVALHILQYCQIDVDEMRDMDSLSFATRKKIELARALIGNPRVLILDGISTGMTQPEQAQYCEVVLDYVETFSTTLIVVDNQLDVIRNVCQRVIALDVGEMLADGDVDSVLRNQLVFDRYLSGVTK